MKILHTADWHIGKKLHKYELYEDFDRFISWLTSLLQEREVDVLLVSGDIFDLANPSSEARKQYYRALMKLKKVNCKIILTGGNHDSPAMLEAPKEILKELDIEIVGGLPAKLEEAVIPVKDKHGDQLIIAAIPFLRDADLRTAADGVTYEDRLEATTKGIKNTFFDTAALCAEKFPGIPALAMGHLFAAGIEISESERDIQIGNQAAFQASQFGDYFKYIALGHIHKPQKVSASVPTFYSGSPLPLSFSERKDEKRVLLIDTEKGWDPESISVPGFRKLLKISGTLEQLQVKLDALQNKAENQLEDLIEVELLEEQPDPLKISQLDDLVSSFDKSGFKIVKHRAHFSKREKGAADYYENVRELQDLQPKDVFLELIGEHEYDSDVQQELISAFDELLEEFQQDENLNEER